MHSENRFHYGLYVCMAAVIDVLLTATSSALHLNFAGSGFIHLLLVVIVALKLGFWPATLISIIANLGLNFYLVAPMGSLHVSDSQNLIALLVFEICALLVSQLSADAHFQQTLAVSRREELEKLCSFSRRLLLLNRQESPGGQILRLIQEEFGTSAALFVDGAGSSVQVAAGSEAPAAVLDEMRGAVTAAFTRNQDLQPSAGPLFVRVMRLGSAPIGALGLEGSGMTPFLATAISLSSAIALEREKSLEREAQQAAERKSELLRGAVLDALAHEYKTPLTVIRTAAGGLLEIGSLEPFQSEMVQLIDRQTSRLDSITTQLLQTSQISSHSGVTLETINAEDLVASLVQGMTSVTAGHPVQTILSEPHRHFFADRHLLTTALTQYLDNAAKYSSPGSAIVIEVRFHGPHITFSVQNSGSYIPHGERDRVFDRFHRAPSAASSVSGTGIGLSIVRKIASAHQGRTWVTSDHETGTTFFLSIPTNPKILIQPEVPDHDIPDHDI